MKIVASQTQVCKLKLGTGKAYASMFVVTLQNVFPPEIFVSLDSVSKEQTAFQNWPCGSH